MDTMSPAQRAKIPFSGGAEKLQRGSVSRGGGGGITAVGCLSQQKLTTNKKTVIFRLYWDSIINQQ